MQLSLIEKTTIGQCATIISGVLPQEKKNVKLLSFRAVLPGQLTAAGMSGEFGTVLRDTRHRIALYPMIKPIFLEN